MKIVTVIFEESLHHVCLMHGLKQTFGRMPFLNKKVLEVQGKIATIDNVVAPPPMMRDPERGTGRRGMRNMVGVSYWKNVLSVEYRENMCRREDITAFIQHLIKDYLHFRHPFITVVTEGCEVLEITGRRRIARIVN